MLCCVGPLLLPAVEVPLLLPAVEVLKNKRDKKKYI